MTLIVLTSCSPSSAPQRSIVTHTLRGTVTNPHCSRFGTYAIANARVELRDESGHLLAAGTTSTPAGSMCEATFAIRGVPRASLYAVKIGFAQGPAYSYAQLQAVGWSVKISSTGSAGYGSVGSQGDVDAGYTDGWLKGETVDFFYTKNFYCPQPPLSLATSGCEVGERASRGPVKGPIDPVYLLIPAKGVKASMLQCPVAGHCIDYPRTVDLSHVLGPGSGDAAFPALSQVVTTANHHKIEWWRAEVVWVKKNSAWALLGQGKSRGALEACQGSGDCTRTYPSNIFLYFNVVSEDRGADHPDR